MAGLAFYLFLVQTFAARKPFVDPVIFRDRNFVLRLCFIFVVGIILLASLALITPYLQNLMNYPVLTAGRVLAPSGIGTMVAMMIVGRIINSVDPRHPLASGQPLTVAVLWEMAYFTPDVSQWVPIRIGVPELLLACRAREAWCEGRLIITPHSAFFTPEAWDDTRLKAAETMRAALVGPRPQNVITPEMF